MRWSASPTLLGPEARYLHLSRTRTLVCCSPNSCSTPHRNAINMSFCRSSSQTLRCEHSCPYCQVSRQSTDRSRFDMSEETAMRALDIAFASPAARIKIEFQGGEPLLNFPMIKTIVAAANARNGKKVDFVIASNLALLDDTVLDFCKANNILLSTSLDGPADLHNKNRPRPGANSHELAVAGIRRAKEILGQDRVGALMTTTEASLG